MGNVGAISVHADQESISSPGEKSAITDPIGQDLVDDVHEFFSELIEVSRDPINYVFQEQFFVKELQLEESGPDEFTCKVILDGAKLKRLIPQKPDESDVCRSHFHVVVDRKELSISSLDYATDGTGERRLQICSKLHPNEAEKNMRCEIWGITKDGERKAGKFIAGMAEFLWVKPLLLCRVGQKVKVRSSIDSIDTGGRSCLTEPLDDFFTAEQFYEALLQVLKQEAIDAKCEIEYKSDKEFEARVATEFPLPKELINPETGQQTFSFHAKRIVVHDPDGLTLCMHEYVLDELTMNSFWRIQREPVRCEYWQVMPSGIRSGGGKQAMAMRLLLMKLISEVDVREQIESLKETSDNFMF